MRLKEIHALNMPQYANKVMEFTMTILNEKLKKRVFVSDYWLKALIKPMITTIYFYHTSHPVPQKLRRITDKSQSKIVAEGVWR